MSGMFIQRMRLAAGAAERMELAAARSIVRYQAEMYADRLWKHSGEMVWTNMAMPTEPFYALGLTPVHMELTAGWLSTLGLAERCIRTAEEAGVHVSLCSYHKALIGAMELGELPPPQYAVCTSHICDGGNGMMQYFRRRFGTKTHLISVPYHPDEYGALGYVRDQIKEMMETLSAQTGRRVDRSALALAARRSNNQRRDWLQANNLRKTKVLFPGHLALRNLFGAAFLSGSEKGRQIAREHLSQLTALSRGKEGALAPHGPSKRILWVHFAPLHAGELMRWFERSGCLIAFDITGWIYWPRLDEADPVQSFARKALSHFYLGDSRARMELYRRVIGEFHIDALVLLAHSGCRAIPGAAWELRQLSRRLHVPFFELPGDCIDPRGMPREQARLRLEAFRESLLNSFEGGQST